VMTEVEMDRMFAILADTMTEVFAEVGL
jgi:hypothetical protein